MPDHSNDEQVPAERSSARPNSDVTTGRSKMAEFGAALAANYTITNLENELEYPATVHICDPNVIFRILYSILFMIGTAISRDLGFPDITAQQQAASLRVLIRSVAFDALIALHAVAFNKARRLHYNSVGNDAPPPLTYSFYPVYITTLINSFGPIQRNDLPSRRLHIPYFSKAALDAVRPQGYQSHLSSRFNEKIQKSKFAMSHVDFHATSSSPWWTLWPQKLHSTQIADDSELTTMFSTYRVFSPVKYDELEPYFKLAVIYGQQPITSPGLCFYSTTEWYSADEFDDPINNLPLPDHFPIAARLFPAFVNTCSAFIAQVESRRLTIQIPDAPGSQAESSSAAQNRTTKKRKLVLTARSGSPSFTPSSPGQTDVAMTDDNTINQYRIVYYYFDHIALNEAKPHEYQSWAIQLNQAN